MEAHIEGGFKPLSRNSSPPENERESERARSREPDIQTNNFSGTFGSGGPFLAGNIIETRGGDINFDTYGGPKNQCLHDLLLTDPRHDKARIEESKDELLEDSYVWILGDKSFQSWFDDDNTRLLWINGDPGKGKTMIMIGLVDVLSKRLKSESTALSYFFCQSTKPELNNAVSVLRGLIYILVAENKSLIRYLQKEYDDRGKSMFEGENAFFALQELLSKILDDSKLPRVYLMVDALDECDHGRPQLLNLIVRSVSAGSSKVKWLVTSRNEPDICEKLGPNELHSNVSLELNYLHISDAVSKFIDSKVRELARSKKYKSELEKHVKDYLYKNSEGTFLWVALVCKELQRARTWKVGSVLEKFPAGLEPLYERILEGILQGEEPDDAKFCQQILIAVTLSHRPMHLRELETIAVELPKEDTLNELLELCSSLITVREEVVYFVHQSAKDYFNTGKGSRIFPSGQAEEHRKIVERCLDAMSDTLREDVCHLQRPGALMSELRSILDQGPLTHIRYACCYWVYHIRDITCNHPLNHPLSQANLSDGGKVHTFLQEHFLHWLEALGLMENISEGVLMVKILESLLTKANGDSHLLPMVHDAKRFILYNRSIIEEAPLQLYSAALIFLPTASFVRKTFLGQPPSHQWICRLPRVKNNWSSELQILEGHSGIVSAVAFSPDGQVLASASFDNTVRLWDSATGGLQKTLEGHSSWVRAVAFSPDGQVLASASFDNTVRLWNPVTGGLQKTLEGHSHEVMTVAFSPDGQVLVSASYGSKVRLWDPATGGLQKTLKGHFHEVTAVAFSPDGQVLASASYDNTVRLWDPATGGLQKTLEGHSDAVNAVAFSPDGQVLASASYDHTVRLWDPATGGLQKTLEGHSDKVNAVAFSPDGQVLASASYDNTVRLWYPATGGLQKTLEGHPGVVNAVAFSPDSQVLASASNDNTVRLWDPATGGPQKTLEGHSGVVRAVAFSLDSQVLASASNDNTVRLWDPATGGLQETLKGHFHEVRVVAFSPDGQVLASASFDSTVRLWDPATGGLQKTLKGHSDIVLAVAFSPDGQVLASASFDSTVRLWDPATGGLQKTLKGHSGIVRAVAFSPDGQVLASASSDSTVRLWDPATGGLQKTFEDHSDMVRAVVFSPDGEVLASASDDCTVRLWSIKRKEIIQTFNTKGIVYRLSFTCDGSHLETNLGILKLKLPAPYMPRPQPDSTSPLSVKGNWVTLGTENILWLPPDYRPYSVAVRNNIVAMGCVSGRVVLIGFNLDAIPLRESFRIGSDVERSNENTALAQKQLSSILTYGLP